MITHLIPQRAPVLMVDDAEKAGESMVRTFLRVGPDNWFYKDGVLLEAGIIEHMAQSAAVMVGLQCANEKPKEGYIGDIKDLVIYRLPENEEKITSEISIITQLDNITLIEAVSSINEEICAKARLKVFIAE